MTIVRRLFMVHCCISLTGIFSIWAQEEMYGRGRDDHKLTDLKAEYTKLERFKEQIVVTVTVTSEVMGARRAGKCEAPTLSDEHMMQRIGGGQGLRVRGAAHTKHGWPEWERSTEQEFHMRPD